MMMGDWWRWFATADDGWQWWATGESVMAGDWWWLGIGSFFLALTAGGGRGVIGESVTADDRRISDGWWQANQWRLMTGESVTAGGDNRAYRGEWWWLAIDADRWLKMEIGDDWRFVLTGDWWSNVSVMTGD
jgi:hypothetical protein